MPKYTVRKGKWYVARISPRLAEIPRRKQHGRRQLENAGFTKVLVKGRGRDRGRRLWPNEDATAEKPSQIDDIIENAIDRVRN